MPRLAVLVLGAAAAVAPVGADAHPGARAEERSLTSAADGGLDPEAALRRAAARRELGDLDGAADDVARAAATGLAPPAQLAHERARLASARGDATAAEGFHDDALRAARPDGAAEATVLYVETLALRAALRTARGATEDARSDWDAAFATRPTADFALARGRLDERHGDLARAADGYREALRAVDAVALRRALAALELRRERWDAALAVAEEALRAPSARVDWLLVRADAQQGAGRAERAAADRKAALTEADRALAARPSDLRQLARGRALLALGRRGEALREAEAVLRLRPSLSEARDLLDAAREPARPPHFREASR